MLLKLVIVILNQLVYSYVQSTQKYNNQKTQKYMYVQQESGTDGHDATANGTLFPTLTKRPKKKINNNNK